MAASSSVYSTSAQGTCSRRIFFIASGPVRSRWSISGVWDRKRLRETWGISRSRCVWSASRTGVTSPNMAFARSKTHIRNGPSVQFDRLFAIDNCQRFEDDIVRVSGLRTFF